jgi:peptidoglycan hydrolase CwlO-like protein
MVSKADASLLTNAKSRKRVLEKEAAQLQKQISKLAAQLSELQQKIEVIDKLIESEGPKKKASKSATGSKSSPVVGMGGRNPAAIRK